MNSMKTFDFSELDKIWKEINESCKEFEELMDKWRQNPFADYDDIFGENVEGGKS